MVNHKARGYMGTRLINRTERLAAIEQMLFRSAMGLRAVEIAQACGVDRRTIYRDLALLGEIGVPIYQKDGRFFINREHYLANVRLSTSEAVALFLAARVFSQHSSQQNPHIVSALRKLTSALPSNLDAHVTFVTESLHDGPVDPGFIQVMDTIIRAWDEGRKVKLWYSPTSGDETVAREFAVYFIEPTPSAEVYIIGYDTTAERIQSLLLARVKRVQLLRATYEIPAYFNPRPYLSAAWGVERLEADEPTQVVLAFSGDLAPLVRERLWHPSQQIEMLDDGRCLLRVRVTDWRHMLSWIRSWGAQVEVLEPKPLCDWLLAEAKQIAARYSQARALT